MSGICNGFGTSSGGGFWLMFFINCRQIFSEDNRALFRLLLPMQ